MSNIITNLSDEKIIELIHIHDRLHLPINRRFDGDDSALNLLMDEMNIPRTLVEKLLILGLVMRESISRGLTVPKGK